MALVQWFMVPAAVTIRHCENSVAPSAVAVRNSPGGSGTGQLMVKFPEPSVVMLVETTIGDAIQARTAFINKVFDHKYYFDWFNENVLAAGSRLVGNGLWKGADKGLIDGLLVNGSARLMGHLAARLRTWQSGYLYHYAFAMIIGLIGILAFWVVRS
jgi:NADH:ubiquinone oxidoreductase subunit 5 (subunit L)/multisubunit Na+/H+ antiporter MnhA subunit